MTEISLLRSQYNDLTFSSDAEYRIAGEAMREHDYEKYKLHVDRSWNYANQAGALLLQMTEDERQDIKQQALQSMAVAFVRGLGRVSTLTRKEG